MFYTEAPSRIKDPLCAGRILKERAKPKFVGIPPDYEKVQRQLKREFGVCHGHNCNNPLLPLSSFKVNGKMYCEPCYRMLSEQITGFDKCYP
tara:strand:- start:6185 stop:6460 length:276 start_codon:yes stop_codon:yes gene_type:complete